MEESHRRLESMLKMLLAKDGLTAPEAQAAVFVAGEDHTDVHAPLEDTALTTSPQTMPSPTRDTTEVAEEGDADDVDKEEESGEVREEEVLDAGGSEEVIQGGATEEVPQGGGLEEALQGAVPSEVLGGARKQKEPQTLASRPATNVTVQKVLAVVTDEPPKDVHPDKPEQEAEAEGASTVRGRRASKPAQAVKSTKAAGLSKPPKAIRKVPTPVRVETGRKK